MDHLWRECRYIYRRIEKSFRKPTHNILSCLGKTYFFYIFTPTLERKRKLSLQPGIAHCKWERLISTSTGIKQSEQCLSPYDHTTLLIQLLQKWTSEQKLWSVLSYCIEFYSSTPINILLLWKLLK